ncbi:retropepsin-like aspartic protease [Gimibacter soli]|uniref:Aspartyl protease family protein n=1 Tax=Gimibacter soli TaxID=3024400 RepID=A0AAF0BFV9_9PROT|nr:aspartyl protease family protein [Gimibacter soli]WCL52918.1 aspartyl protease family protein [Gimibacter soli]
MIFRQKSGLCAALILLSQAAPAADKSLKDILAAPPVIERKAPATSVPVKVRAGKLFVEAAANGQTRQFIFDTGSPTILTRRFADTLALTYVGQNTGVDANGAKVTMDIAVLDQLSIGDVEFRKVPVLVFDYSGLPLAPCIFDGGVIGSEIFPGSVWQIDAGKGRLSVAKDASALGIKQPLVRTRLYDFGYPHAPIVDYKAGNIADKALFDTGSTAEVSLFSGVYENPTVQAAILPGSMKAGRGSEGTSAGGTGAATDLARFELSRISLGSKAIQDLHGTTRSVPPTLLGAGLLQRYIVSLDYTKGEFILEKRAEAAPARKQAGYAVTLGADHASVTQLFHGSEAEAAGLKLGDQVIALQGQSLQVSSDTNRCEKANWLFDSFDAAAPTTITVLRDGAPITLQIPASN